jgi:hypothetical protein
MNIIDKLNEYCLHGGLYNPELMEHEKVRNLLIEAREEIALLQESLQGLVERAK